MARIKFMNTEIDNLTMDEAVSEIDKLIQQNKNSLVITPNVDHIVRLEKNDDALLAAHKEADLILTDGQPLIWLSRWYKTPIKEKVSGSDLFPNLCKMAAEKGYKMFFLGASLGVAKKAAENLMHKYRGLNVVGTYSPPIGFENDEKEIDKIIEMINNSRSHMLILALGCPKQELFYLKNKDRLNVPVSLGLGASIDYEAGKVKRAPKWMSDHGMEWLYRIIQDPGRMAKRYFVDDRKIFSVAIKYKKLSRMEKGYQKESIKKV